MLLGNIRPQHTFYHSTMNTQAQNQYVFVFYILYTLTASTAKTMYILELNKCFDKFKANAVTIENCSKAHSKTDLNSLHVSCHYPNQSKMGLLNTVTAESCNGYLMVTQC